VHPRTSCVCKVQTQATDLARHIHTGVTTRGNSLEILCTILTSTFQLSKFWSHKGLATHSAARATEFLIFNWADVKQQHDNNYAANITILIIMMMFLWVLVPCTLVGRYQCFGETFYLHLQGWVLALCRRICRYCRFWATYILQLQDWI
jgi:hypothetical protein